MDVGHDCMCLRHQKDSYPSQRLKFKGNCSPPCSHQSSGKDLVAHIQLAFSPPCIWVYSLLDWQQNSQKSISTHDGNIGFKFEYHGNINSVILCN